jgi:hypothetical protein
MVMPYSTNLTDAEWETLEPLLNQILPLKKKFCPLTGLKDKF